MKRVPNPWIALPSVALGAIAGGLGWIVTEVSCRQVDVTGQVTSCIGWASAIALTAFLVVTFGVATVLVLVYRSLTEWRERNSPP